MEKYLEKYINLRKAFYIQKTNFRRKTLNLIHSLLLAGESSTRKHIFDIFSCINSTKGKNFFILHSTFLSSPTSYEEYFKKHQKIAFKWRNQIFIELRTNAQEVQK